MKNSGKQITPHHKLTEMLFVFKNDVSLVFKDVLGIHGIDHIALTRVDEHRKLLVFSSTPAMEFNLFNSDLWRYDKTYLPLWFEQNTFAPWQALYETTHFDKLNYIKALKHGYTAGITLSISHHSQYYICSAASSIHQDSQGWYEHCKEDFYKISQYCIKNLHFLFDKANLYL